MQPFLLFLLIGLGTANPVDRFRHDIGVNVNVSHLHDVIDKANLRLRGGNSPEDKQKIDEAVNKIALSRRTEDDPSNSIDDWNINLLNQLSGLEKDLYEGDIVLTDEQLAVVEKSKDSSRSRRQAIKGAGFSWGLVNPVIPYTFAPGYPRDRAPFIEAAMKFWQDRTCVRFKRATTERDRVQIRESGGCSSSVGRVGGTQGLNLGANCMAMGTIAHELAHTMGFFHMQSRVDRDDFVIVNWDNIMPNFLHNFDIEGAETSELHDIPYEFGSNMHYYMSDFALDTKKPVLIARTPFEPYQQGMMGRLPTFYDIMAVNRHLGCYDKCKTPLACANGGIQDVNNCNRCVCTLGWTGDRCSDLVRRPLPSHSHDLLQNFRHFMGRQGAPSAREFSVQYYVMTVNPDLGGNSCWFMFVDRGGAPIGKRITMTPTVLGTKWTNSCDEMGIEVQYRNDTRRAGVQVCDFRVKYEPIVSEGNRVIIQGYTRGGLSVIDMTYSAIAQRQDGMSSLRRRPAIAIPGPYDADIMPIIGKYRNNDDVSLMSPIHVHVHRPTSLQQVVDETHFSKNEVRSIYRAFKETSPNALINKDILREKFGELFPHGDIEHYSDLLFETFDNDGSGTINFQEFVHALSVLCRGTIEEKIDWLYKLYDPKGKGEVTWHRLYYVITATDDLIGRKAKPIYSRDQRAARANAVFSKFDIDGTGKISKENFFYVCKTDPQIMDSIASLYTILPG